MQIVFNLHEMSNPIFWKKERKKKKKKNIFIMPSAEKIIYLFDMLTFIHRYAQNLPE